MKKWFYRFLFRQVIKFIRKYCENAITEKSNYGESTYYEWRWSKMLEDDLFNRKKSK